MKIKGPKRIICLTEEPTEILYLLGEQDRIVGISRYTVRPEEAKSNHPVVSAFVDGSVKKISELKPDLVIGFSDIQGDLAAKLIKANLQVLIFNQRSIEEILEVILTIGRIVSAEGKAQKLVDSYKKRLDAFREKSNKIQNKPKVYVHKDGKTILIPRNQAKDYIARGWKKSALRAETSYESKLAELLNQRLK